MNKNHPQNQRSGRDKALKTARELTIACILDQFSYECFKYEASFVQLEPESFEETLTMTQPAFLLVESAWRGKKNKWHYKIGGLHTQTGDAQNLQSLIIWCKKHNIPTVLWNKEDPANFHHFIEAAKYLDYVFTTDENSIPLYKEILGHDNIYVLPFAAQPKIHNPINRKKEHWGKVAFAGTWYNQKYPARRKHLDMLLKPAIKYGLHLYDRMYETKHSYYEFPEFYQPYIKGYLSYNEMISAYKKYDVFLNVNSVYDSPSMFSRRVYELLASGTNVISSYSLGVENFFPGIVRLSKSEEDTAYYLKELLENEDLMDRLSLLGQREVFMKHTYRHRLEIILNTLEIDYRKEPNPGVSVVCVTNLVKNAQRTIKNFLKQSYATKELVLVLTNDEIKLNKFKEQISRYKNINVLQLQENTSYSDALEYGISKTNYPYISVFKDSDYYAPNFLLDMVQAFNYTEAGIVGKNTYYAYLNNNKALALINPKKENQYTDTLSNTALLIKKDVFNGLNLGEILLTGNLFSFCHKNNIKLYSADRFNYLSTTYNSTEEIVSNYQIISPDRKLAAYVTV